MTVARLDKRLGELGTRAGALTGRMEDAAARYLDAMTPWAARRFESDVTAAVVGAPEVTQELGAEALADLRRGLEGLSARAPELVRKKVATAGAWPHRWDVARGPIRAGFYGEKGAGGKREVTVPAFLEARLRLLLGTSGHLLARHGYEHHVRRTYDRAYLRTDYHPPEYLARSLDGHEEFHPLLEEYGDLCDEYAGVLAGLQEAGHDRAVRTAGDLWKQA
ncbi:MAG: hypothetical protein JW785_10005 [Acidimicrobiia bacterium]|nr:hypothetical protein [Acidimicrobiia bacterium]